MAETPESTGGSLSDTSERSENGVLLQTGGEFSENDAFVSAGGEIPGNEEIEVGISGDGEPPELLREPRNNHDHYGDHTFHNNVTIAGTLRTKRWVHPYGCMFQTKEKLLEEYPNPTKGMWAFVGTSFPGRIWICMKDGEWVEGDSHLKEFDNILKDYAKTEDLPDLTSYATQQWVKNQGYLKDGDLRLEEILNRTDITRLENLIKKAAPKDHTHVISEVTGLQDVLDDKLDGSIFSDLFEKVNIGSEESPRWAIKAKYGLYTDQFLSARGLNPNESAVNPGLDETQLAQYLTANNYATQSWVQSQGYLTSLPDLSPYALKTDIPDLSPYALKTDIPDLSPYALKTDIPSLTGYATETWVTGKGYLTKSEADSAYLTISNFNSFKALFDSMFLKEPDGKGGSRIKALFGLYTDQFLSARGLNPNESAVNPGLDETQLAQYLTANNYAKKSDIPSLDGYALKSELVSSAERSLWNQTATNLSAILGSDADSVINKWDEIVAFLDTYTEADTLANLLSNKANALHSHAISDVSGLQSALDAKLPVTTFDTFKSGYDSWKSDIDAFVTKFNSMFIKEPDGKGGSRIKALFGLYTDQFLSARGLNPNESAVNPGLDETQLAQYLTANNYAKKTDIPSLAGYATETWVTGKGYLTSSSLTGYATQTWVENKGYALSSSLGNYLPLTGGTLTGILTIKPTNTSGLQDGLILHDQGSGSGEGLRIRWTSASYTSGITLGANTSDDTLICSGALQAGKLIAQGGADAKIVLNNTDTENYWSYISFRQNGTEYGRLGIQGSTILSWNGNKIWHSGNQGSGSGLDADTVDGVHNGALTAKYIGVRDVRDAERLPSYFEDYTASFWFNSVGTPSNNWYSGLQIKGWSGAYASWQICSNATTSTNDNVHLHFRTGNGDSWYPWKTLAFTSSNVASATKLQTARTIWGQSFDGSANVSGALSGVTNIVASGMINIPRADISTYLFFQNPNASDGKGIYFSSQSDGGLVIATHTKTSWTKSIIKIGQGGNFGIGTMSPAYDLDVNGTARATALRIGDCEITYDSNAGMLKFSKGIYSVGAVSARGANSSGGSGSGGTAFNLLKSWPSTDPGSGTTDALGANLGWELYQNKLSKTDAQSLYLGKSAQAADSAKLGGIPLSRFVYGTGDTATIDQGGTADGVRKSGFYRINADPNAQLVIHSSHSSNNYAFQLGTTYGSNQPLKFRHFVNNVWDGWKTLAFTSDIPTKVSQLTNDSGYLTSHQSLANYVTLNTAQTISALKTHTAGLKVSGRVQNSGDDEGIVIGRASNNYAGLILGEPSGVRSVFYLLPSNNAVWRFNDGTTSFEIAHPKKSGTIALTSDITSAVANYLPLTGGTLKNGAASSPLILDTNATTEIGMRLAIGGTIKGWVGYNATSGVYLWNATKQWYLGLKDNGSLYYNGGTIWHSGNQGSGSGLDADTVDGVHNGALTAKYIGVRDVRDAERLPSYFEDYTASFWFNSVGTPSNNWYSGLQIKGWSGAYASWQICSNATTSTNDNVHLHFRTGNGDSWYPWKTLAFTSSNVASATKLQTARTIWGQSFDGSANVSGALSGVTNIVASGMINIPRADISTYLFFQNPNASDGKGIYFSSQSDGGLVIATHTKTSWTKSIIKIGQGGNFGIGTMSPAYDLDVNGTAYATKGMFGTSSSSYALNTASFICDSWVRTTGSTGWYNESYGGGWYMKDATYIRNYNNKRLLIEGVGDYYAVWLSSGGFCCEGYAGASWNNGYGSLNVGIADNNAQTPIIVAYRNGSAAAHTGANRLFALELLNSGTDLHFAFGGTNKFNMSSAGVFYASAGIYSDGYVSARGQNTSDIRLKTEIRDFNASEIIKALNPKQFKWNKLARSKFAVFDTDEVQFGLIAQETKPVAPWLVDENMFNDGLWGVHYGVLIPVLTKAQKEQIFRIDQLIVSVKSHEDRIAELEKENRELKREIEQLKYK